MLRLHVFAPAMGTISPSPFSVKSLLLLQMSGLPYTRVAGDPRKAPKSKLPVLEDDGQMIPDSQAIQAHLAQAHGFDADAHLSDRQRAEAAALRHLVEDHLYWCLVYSRWIDSPGATREAFFAALPLLLRRPVFGMVRRQVAQALYGQGMGRHAKDEIYAMGEEALATLALLLGTGPYVFGDRPGNIDTVVFGLLENLIPAELDTPLATAARAHDGLVRYHAHLRDGLAAPLLP